MVLMDFIKKQFIDVIEWTDDSRDTLSYRFPDEDKEIKNGAQLIVRDGEGATKCFKVSVQGAEDDVAAKRIALSIANSPLVKTAMAGNDANWGRVVAAVGKSGEKADRDRLRIWFGKQLVADKGERAPNYNEEKATKEVSKLETEITVDLRLGKGKARVWTCDLTHGYIDINGSYRS